MEILPIVFGREELCDRFKTKKGYENWLQSKVRNGSIIKIRNNLYSPMDITTGDVFASPFQIASRVSASSFLCLHSALEYYGLANQVFHTLSVGSTTRFVDFEFEGKTYGWVRYRKPNGVDWIASESIRVTSLEKTLLDCFSHLEKAGGLEEVLSALEVVTFVDEAKLRQRLQEENKTVLYKKAGYFFSLFRSSLPLSDAFYSECRAKITKKVDYLLPGDSARSHLDKTWRLMIPEKIAIYLDKEMT